MNDKLDVNEKAKLYYKTNKERINEKRRENYKAKHFSETNKRGKFINET